MGLLSKLMEEYPNFNYPVEIKTWDIHLIGIANLLKTNDLDLNNMSLQKWFTGKLVPEPDNEYDKNAIKVYAGTKGKYFDIGYVSADIAPLLKKDIKKEISGSHYWSIRMNFNVLTGISFDLYLKESKFVK